MPILAVYPVTRSPGRAPTCRVGSAKTIPGLMSTRPQVYARVYLSENGPDERPWFWTIWDKDSGIATGYEATADDAIEAVDRTYAGWLDAKAAS